ncbi:hypothetical protein OG426_04835 [Streptomyces canus]|uniref:hypothetical protein n=1 Tax=Streptomyces canus TaxID=58343 RepID=UPI00386DA213|nr:hypothetical protein OG426_04835 [Streptomyces canus]
MTLVGFFPVVPVSVGSSCRSQLVRRHIGPSAQLTDLHAGSSWLQGVTPDLEPCVDLLTALHRRRSKLDRQIDALTRSREALDAYIRVSEQNIDPLAPSTCAAR